MIEVIITTITYIFICSCANIFSFDATVLLVALLEQQTYGKPLGF